MRDLKGSILHKAKRSGFLLGSFLWSKLAPDTANQTSAGPSVTSSSPAVIASGVLGLEAVLLDDIVELDVEVFRLFLGGSGVTGFRGIARNIVQEVASPSGLPASNVSSSFRTCSLRAEARS